MVEEVFTQVWSKPPFVVLLGADGCVIGAKSNITSFCCFVRGGWLCNRGEKQYYL